MTALMLEMPKDMRLYGGMTSCISNGDNINHQTNLQPHIVFEQLLRFSLLYFNRT